MKCVVKECNALRCIYNRYKHERLKECSLRDVNISSDGRCTQFETNRYNMNWNKQLNRV